MAAGVGLRAALSEARYGVRVRRRRSLLTALGIALAAAMLSAAIVVSDGLGRGFDRAARAAQLPDIIVRFNSEPTDRIAQRIESLPDVAAFSLRQEVTNIDLSAGDHLQLQRLGRGCRPRPSRIRDRRRPRDVEPPVRRGRGRAWPGRRVGRPPRGQARHRRPRQPAGRRVLREPRQRLLSAGGTARICVGGGAGAAVRRLIESTGRPGADLAARPALPQRGPRPGPRDQLRAPGPSVRDEVGGPGAPQPGRRHRDRPARRAFGDRSGHRSGDARGLGARRGPAPASGNRRAPRRRRLAGPPGADAGARGDADLGAGGDAWRDRRDARHLLADQPAADAAE